MHKFKSTILIKSFMYHNHLLYLLTIMLLNAPTNQCSGTVGGWFSSITQSMSLDEAGMSAELRMFNKIEREGERKLARSLSQTHEEIDHTGSHVY